MSPPRKLKIMCHALDATGHIMPTIGMAQALMKRGHEIVFLVNEAIAEFVRSFDLRVVTLQVTDPNNFSDNPGRDIGRMLIETGYLSGKSSLEKLPLLVCAKEKNFLHTCFKLMADFNPQIQAAIEREKPDCFILDHMYFPPAIGKCNIPWVFTLSAQPLTLYDSPDLPPAFSGYPTDDRTEWEEYRRIMIEEMDTGFNHFQDKLNEMFDYKPNNHYKRHHFFNISTFFNVYQYPKELDYDDVTGDLPNYCNVDAFIRTEPVVFEIPEEIRPKNGEKLLYLSMGSMGGYDLDMMKRLVDILAKCPHKVIVAKGPLGEQYELPPNMWGKNILPQTRILPLVDLVLTHGGNNSVCESFYNGKPIIVLPLFADQYDNGQRIQEKKFGLRMDPYRVTEKELLEGIESIFADKDLHERLAAARKRILSYDSKMIACERIEQALEERIRTNSTCRSEVKNGQDEEATPEKVSA